MNPTTMLDLQKLVLKNVSEDQELFEKELRKSFQWLSKDELFNLYTWLLNNFSNNYHNLIRFIFSGFHKRDLNQR